MMQLAADDAFRLSVMPAIGIITVHPAASIIVLSRPCPSFPIYTQSLSRTSYLPSLRLFSFSAAAITLLPRERISPIHPTASFADKYRKPEQSSHSGANGFGVIDIRASRKNNTVVSESFSRAHYRSEVSGVAHLRQHNNALVFLPLGKSFRRYAVFSDTSPRR